MSVNHRAACLSLAAALLLSTLLGLASVPARVSASSIAPAELLVTVADLPAGFAPTDDPGVASLLPDSLARQAAASFRREPAGPGLAYVRQVVLAFDGRDASEYLSRFQTLMLKHQGYSTVSSDDADFRLARHVGEESGAVAASARGEILVVTTVAGPAGTVGPDDAAGLTRIATARVPAIDQAAIATTGDPEGRSMANAQPGAGHLDIPNQQDAGRWPQPVANLPAGPSISVAQARSDRPVGDPSLDVYSPVQNVAKRPPNWDTNLVAFTKSLEPLINEFWNRALSMTDVDYYPPRLVVVPEGEVVMTGCMGADGGPAPADGLFYCPADTAVYIYEPFMKDDLIAGADWQSRDYVVVTVLAHEWGHHIQRLTGLAWVSGVLMVNQQENWPLISRQRELQADCYAGLFTRYARDSGWMNHGDLDEASEAMLRAGDDHLESAGHHGLPEQRREWFARGYVHYTFRDCEPW
jgi:predicted metalloprotease